MAEAEAQPNPTTPRRKGNPQPKLVARRKARYLQSMAKHLDPVKACQFAKINRTTVWHWKQDDPEFVERLDLLIEYATENIEGAVYRRAMKMSTQDARLWLQAHKRELYGDRVDIFMQLRDDPRCKALMLGIAQLLQDFVPKELFPSAINRLRSLTGVLDGDSGPVGPSLSALPNPGTSEES